MKFLTVFFIILFSSWTSSLHADIKGNGGKGLVCIDKTSGTKDAVLLDFYEGRYRWNFIPSIGDNNLSVMEKVNFVLDRLSTFDSNLANQFKKEAASFFENAAFPANGYLSSISDTDLVSVIIPYNCFIAQLAVQQQPELPGDKFYNIAKDLWDIMDNDNKAGLILHEIIFKKALQSGHTTSRPTRYFVSYICSDQMLVQGFVGYIKALEVLALDNSTFTTNSGVNLDVHSIEFYKSGKLKKGTLSKEITLYYLNNKEYPFTLDSGTSLSFYESGAISLGFLKKNFEIPIGKCNIVVSVSGQSDFVEFHENGKIKSIPTNLNYDGFDFCLKKSTPTGTVKLDPLTGKNRIDFYPTDVPMGGTLLEVTTFDFKYGTLTAAENTDILFYANGNVKQVVLDAGFYAPIANSEYEEYFAAGETVRFNENGSVISNVK